MKTLGKQEFPESEDEGTDTDDVSRRKRRKNAPLPVDARFLKDLDEWFLREIREGRPEHNQAWLAREIGYKDPSLTKMRQGRTRSTPMVTAICDVTGIEPTRREVSAAEAAFLDSLRAEAATEEDFARMLAYLRGRRDGRDKK